MKTIKPKKKERAFVPAGQSTQMIVGACLLYTSGR